MEVIIVVSVLLIMCLLWLNSYLERNNYVSEITHVLISSLSEKILEFRIQEDKVHTKIREFEVKTIRQTYSQIRMKGRKILSRTEIDRFTVSEAECLLIGILDPVSLNHYHLKIKDLDK